MVIRSCEIILDDSFVGNFPIKLFFLHYLKYVLVIDEFKFCFVFFLSSISSFCKTELDFKLNWLINVYTNFIIFLGTIHVLEIPTND